MKMKYSRKFVLVTGLLSSLSAVSLQAEKMILGGKSGWPEFLESVNITAGKGRYGYDCIQLSTNSFMDDEYTDLLMNFENQAVPVTAGGYSVRRNSMKHTNAAVMGKGAGLSRNTGGISLFGAPGTLFGSEGPVGSFSIEFWLSPSVSENGETVFEWQTSKKEESGLVPQTLNAVFRGGHLEWTADNLFGPGESGEIILRGTSTVVPDRWSCHALSYDCDTGIFEYIVNGITEDIKYITPTGTEDGTPALAVLGTPSEISLCTEFTGKMDDFRILRRPYSPPDYQTAENAGGQTRMTYTPHGGRFVTKPIMFASGAVINSVSAVTDTPDQTGIDLYIRSGDNYYSWTADSPEWIPISEAGRTKNTKGLYVQISAELYPDGNGTATPSVTEIEIEYTEIPRPLPPFTVSAEAGNGCVTLNWNYSVDENAGGYYIYYGNRPGEYLGRQAAEGSSPINAGNRTSFKLTGLENGKIYYFAISSWSKTDERITGELSAEVFARPLERLPE